MRLSSCEVFFLEGHLPFRNNLTMVWYAHQAQVASFSTFPGMGGWPGGRVVKSKIKLISAKAQAQCINCEYEMAASKHYIVQQSFLNYFDKSELYTERQQVTLVLD